jgi:hypothetical protein
VAKRTSSRPGVSPRRKGAAKGAPPSRRPPQPPHRQQRAQRQRRLVIAGGFSVVVVAAVVIVALVLGHSSLRPSAVNWTTASGVKVYGGIGPEGIPLEEGAFLGPADVGLTGSTIDAVQCNSREQIAYHHHALLAIFINGQPRSVPLAIGMVPPAIVTNAAGGQFAEGSHTRL